MRKPGQRQFGSVRKLPSGRWQARYLHGRRPPAEVAQNVRHQDRRHALARQRTDRPGRRTPLGPRTGPAHPRGLRPGMAEGPRRRSPSGPGRSTPIRSKSTYFRASTTTCRALGAAATERAHLRAHPQLVPGPHDEPDAVGRRQGLRAVAPDPDAGGRRRPHRQEPVSHPSGRRRASPRATVRHGPRTADSLPQCARIATKR